MSLPRYDVWLTRAQWETVTRALARMRTCESKALFRKIRAQVDLADKIMTREESDRFFGRNQRQE